VPPLLGRVDWSRVVVIVWGLRLGHPSTRGGINMVFGLLLCVSLVYCNCYNNP
jgi:hypothetical protein